MVDPLSPLYIPPRLAPGLLSWLWSFSRHCSARHVEYSRSVLEPFARTSLELHDEIGRTAPAEVGYDRGGYLEIFRSDKGRRMALAEAEFARRQGFDPTEVSRSALQERDPGLCDSVEGGYAYGAGRTMDPFLFVEHVTSLAQREGARVRTGVEVTEVVTRGEQAVGVRTATGEEIEGSAIVLATGAYSPDLYSRLGCPLPIQPAKGYHVDLVAPGGSPAAQEAYLLVETAVFCTPMPGRTRLAGTLEFSGLNHELKRPRLEQLTKGASLYLDGLDDVEVTSEWCGLRPCTPDGLPVVGPLPGWRSVYAATGHAMLGLTFGPATGEALAELLLTGQSATPISGLSPGRFARGSR
jgi:D-amino-acid dehydrogenase